MNIFHAIVLGIIEGLTEFLPISSTFHLIWTAKLMNLEQTDFMKLFEVFIQSGAILAIIMLYRKTFLEDKKLMLKVLAAFIPTAAVGFIFYKLITDVFFTSFNGTLSIFLSVGVFFLLFEMFLHQSRIDLDRDLHSITYFEAIFVGFAQALAVMPGVSRAGAVMVALMFFRFKRSDAAKFSFLLAVPTIFAASGYDLLKMQNVLFASVGNIPLLIVGFIVSFFTAYIVVKWFISFLQHHTLSVFGIYRVIGGFILLFFNVK